MDFDLSAMDTRTLSEAGVALQVRRLDTGEPLLAKDGTPVAITMLGPDSARYRKMQRALVRKRVERAAAGKAEVEADEAEADAISIMAACITGWTGIRDKAGNDVPVSVEAATALLSGFPAIRDQVDAFMANRANFLPGSSNA